MSICLSERYLPFNISELKRVAARCVGRTESDVKEGGYDRTFKVTMHDGFQVIARLSYPSTRPEKLATASEVATMNLIQSLGISAPKVFDYSATARNSVGSEYIMENHVERTLETPGINNLRAEE